MRRVLVSGLLMAAAVVAGGGSVRGAAGDVGGEAGKAVLVLKDLKHGVIKVALSPDGKKVAAVGGDGTARVWDAETGKLLKTFKGHTGVTMSCAWSPDGKQLATGGYDKTINVWDMTTGEIVDHHEQECPVVGIAFVIDEKHFVTLCGETVRWWEEGTEAEMFDKPQGDSTLAAVSATPKGERVVVSDTSGMVRVLDGSSGAKVAEDEVPSTLPPGTKAADKSNWIMSVQGLGEGEALVGDKQSIWVWNWDKGTKDKVKNGGGYAEVLTPDRSLLVLAMSTMVEGVDVKNQTAVVKSDMKNLWITDMSLSRSGERMAICSGGGYLENAWAEHGDSVVQVYDVKAMAALVGSAPAVEKAAAPAKGKKPAKEGDAEMP